MRLLIATLALASLLTGIALRPSLAEIAIPPDAAQGAEIAAHAATIAVNALADQVRAAQLAALSAEEIAEAATAGVRDVARATEEARREVIEVRVSISKQMMEVYHYGELVHEWPVSTARKGKVTPKGSFKPQFLSKNHKSSLYNNAPMPWSIFYSGNYAIHGTEQESKLGRPASAGCVRLSRANAKILFAMVVEEGKDRMKVEIID